MSIEYIPPSKWAEMQKNGRGFVPDEGNNGYGYSPFDGPKEIVEYAYSRHVSNSNNAQANMVAVFDQYFRHVFEPNFFKWSMIRSQVPFTLFKSNMLSIYKKDRPILVIDPHTPDVDDVSQVPTNMNMLSRFNDFDPEVQNIGTKMAYSLPVMSSDRFELVYRRARMRMDIDVLIIVDTMNQQTNVFNHLLMSIRHRSQFTLFRRVPVLIPKKYIINIAKFHGYDWRSDEFLGFMNSISQYPIRKEIRTNGNYMFFMLQDLHIYVEAPNYPAKDSPEMSDMIEWAARVTDTFTLSADLPLEFLFLTKKELACNFDTTPIEEDENSVSFISPISNDLDWPTEFGDFKIANQVDVELQPGEDPTLSILPLINDFHKDMFIEATKWVANGNPISEIIQIHAYPNGSYSEIGTKLRQDGILELTQAVPNQLYTIRIFMNAKTLNLVTEGREREYIGTIQKPKIQGL